MKDTLDKEIERITFREIWKTIATREGFIKGMLITLLILSLVISTITALFGRDIMTVACQNTRVNLTLA